VSYDPASLPVVTVRFNPRRYQVPEDNFRRFEKHMADSGVPLYVVELALAGRPFTCTEAGNPRHLQLRSDHIGWWKERLINLGVQRLLPADWTKFAWIDADVIFERPDWASETLYALDHHPILQPWSQATDRGPQGQHLKQHAGFGWCWQRLKRGGDKGVTTTGGSYGGTWHSGYAFAATRRFYDAIGGLPDFMVMGSADRELFCACIGEIEKRIVFAPDTSYATMMRILQERAMAAGGLNLGYVEGGITHLYHGPKARRGYGDRFKILQRHRFDPLRDLLTDASGMYRWAPHAAALAAEVDMQLSARDEDNPSLDPVGGSAGS